MLYLKKFNEDIENPLYKEIIGSDFFNQKKWDVLEKNEIEKIEYFFSKHLKEYPHFEVKYTSSFWFFIQNDKYWKPQGNPTITIDKIEDEYFHIRDLRTRGGENLLFYKADTIDGVIQYLNDFMYR